MALALPIVALVMADLADHATVPAERNGLARPAANDDALLCRRALRPDPLTCA
jgi:hypothetical protein